MKKLFALLMGCISLGIYAQSPLASRVHAFENNGIAPIIFAPCLPVADAMPAHDVIAGARSYFIPDRTQLEKLVATRVPFIEMLVEGVDNTYALQLFSVDIVADGFRVSGPQGSIPYDYYTSVVTYRGIVRGDDASLVALTVFPDHIEGIISSPGKGNVVIAPLKNSTTHVVYDDRTLLVPNPLDCATQNPEAIREFSASNEAKAGALDPCVKVYVEADFEMFQDEGGATQAADFIVSFFNVVSTLYFNESINTVISEIFVWTESDPYPTSSSFDALDYFTAYRDDFNGDIAHLVTFDDENLGGVAWLDVLCVPSYRYAYSNISNYFSDFPVYSWTVEVFTHEMGHNLGSPHTHSCDWPGGAIDNCWTTEGGCPPGPAPTDGGTIMSYCHLTGYGINFANGFGPLPGDLIRDEVLSAACLGACELPPANDWPCAATEIPVNTSCVFVAGTNVGAINSVVPAATCDGLSEGDVWFSLTVGPEGYVIIETEGGAVIDDMGMRLYTGTCTDLIVIPGSCVAEGSPYGVDMPGKMLEAPPGTPVFIRLWEVNNDAFGDFSICAYTECADNELPAGIVAEDTILCAGESTTLHIEGGALGTLGHWNWYADDCGGTSLSEDVSLNVSPTTTTTYYVQATGQCDTTACVAVTVEVAPLPEIPVITAGDCSLETPWVDGAAYTWYFEGVVVEGATGNVLEFDTPGAYAVTITTYGGCTATSATITAECAQTGIDANMISAVHLLANPADGSLSMMATGYTGNLQLQLFALTGQLVQYWDYTVSQTDEVIHLPLQVATGLYHLRIAGKQLLQEEMVVIK